MQTVAIVQGRMGSTRLPGKVLLPILGKPMLEHQLNRLQRCRSVDRIVVATSDGSADDPIVELAGRCGVSIFRGSENDVLARYHGAAQAFSAETVIRITADCPLIDPAEIDRVANLLLNSDGRLDYASNTLERTYPRGMDTEAFTRVTLEAAHRDATDPLDREHVTRFIYLRPNRFRLGVVRFERDESRHRWTVDEPADFDLISRMFNALLPVSPTFTLANALDLIAKNPEWSALNAAVEQKKL